jgi:predicted nucleotidyltransferase
MLIYGRPHDDSKGQSSSVETEQGRRFDKALFSTLDALEARKVDYALIGGIAASSLGRPRPTQDIDIFVRPEDAEATLDVLQEFGFETNRFNPSWIYKAYKENVLVDIIFRSEGGFYFDDEMKAHSKLVQYHGRQVRVVAPEDFVLIKCAVHSEEGHHHWHDALAVLSQAKLDWDYLLHRSRKAPRRLMALLVYAQSVDIAIPNFVIHRLFENLFGDTHHGVKDQAGTQTSPKAGPHAQGWSKPASRPQVRTEKGDTYLAAKIREALIESKKTGAMGIDVIIQDGQILVRGQIESEEQHRSIVEVIRQVAPHLRIEDQLHVSDWKGPTEVEVLQ